LNQIFNTSYDQRMLGFLNLKDNCLPAPNEQLLIMSGWLVVTHYKTFPTLSIFLLVRIETNEILDLG